MSKFRGLSDVIEAFCVGLVRGWSVGFARKRKPVLRLLQGGR